MGSPKTGRDLTCPQCGTVFYRSASLIRTAQPCCSVACDYVRRGIHPDPVVNFWRRVDKAGPNGCWIWTGGRDKWGYGDLYFRGKHVQAHRLSWRFLRSEPGKMDVLHKCNNPPCCNPDHLYLGNDLDNARDRDAAGTATRGERNYHAILTEKQVIELRREFRYLPSFGKRRRTNLTELMAKFPGSSREALYMAATGKSWRHLP